MKMWPVLHHCDTVFYYFTIDINPQDIETYNTRLFKEEKDGHVKYILRIASVAKTGEFKYRMLTKTWNKEICLVLQPLHLI